MKSIFLIFYPWLLHRNTLKSLSKQFQKNFLDVTINDEKK